jgi:hypothetical protein
LCVSLSLEAENRKEDYRFPLATQKRKSIVSKTALWLQSNGESMHTTGNTYDREKP